MTIPRLLPIAESFLRMSSRIVVTSGYVDDQEKALRFYKDVLGFMKKEDVPMGEFRWLSRCPAAGGAHRAVQVARDGAMVVPSA